MKTFFISFDTLECWCCQGNRTQLCQNCDQRKSLMWCACCSCAFVWLSLPWYWALRIGQGVQRRYPSHCSCELVASADIKFVAAPPFAPPRDKRSMQRRTHSLPDMMICPQNPKHPTGSTLSVCECRGICYGVEVSWATDNHYLPSLSVGSCYAHLSHWTLKFPRDSQRHCYHPFCPRSSPSCKRLFYDLSQWSSGIRWRTKLCYTSHLAWSNGRWYAPISQWGGPMDCWHFSDQEARNFIFLYFCNSLTGWFQSFSDLQVEQSMLQSNSLLFPRWWRPSRLVAARMGLPSSLACSSRNLPEVKPWWAQGRLAYGACYLYLLRFWRCHLCCFFVPREMQTHHWALSWDYDQS